MQNDGINSKPGWQKVLNNFGYNRTHVVLEKDSTKEKMDFRSSSGSTQQMNVTPYASNQLNQIISEAGNLYNQGFGFDYVVNMSSNINRLAQQDYGIMINQQLEILYPENI